MTRLFKIDPLPDTNERRPTYINPDLVAVITLAGDTATITMNLAYHSVLTTRACGERLIAEMENRQ